MARISTKASTGAVQVIHSRPKKTRQGHGTHSLPRRGRKRYRGQGHG